MLHIVDSEGGQDEVEMAEVSLFLVIELVAEHLHQQPEVLVAVGEVGRQIFKSGVQSLGNFLHLSREVFLSDELGEGLYVVNVGDKSDGERCVLDSPRPDHPHKAHGVTDVSYQQSELVQVGGDAIRHQAQLPDTTVELCSSAGKILVSAFIVMKRLTDCTDTDRLYKKPLNRFS